MSEARKIWRMIFPFDVKKTIYLEKKNIKNADSKKQAITFLNFVKSIEDFFKSRKYITAKQEKGLDNIANYLSYTPYEREGIREGYYDWLEAVGLP